MNKGDFPFIALLLLLAGFIWLRDLVWISSVEDSLPIIIAIPLFIWLGRPWTFRENFLPLPVKSLFFGALLCMFGILFNLTLMLAIGWITFLWAFLSTRLIQEKKFSAKRLLVLPFLSFPWITLDGETLSWWFRLSGTWTAEQLFSLLKFDVIREGTTLLVLGLPFSIGPACSGLNVLQSMLIAGSVLAYIYIGDQPSYWWNILFIAAIAWFANTLRILTICVAALTISPEFALGLFHDWGGWLVIFIMFGLCTLIFSMQQKNNHTVS